MQTSIKIRISEELKNHATHVLRDCGLTMSSAIRLFLEQVVHTQGIPFEVKHPSQEMKIALQEAHELEKNAQHPYSSIDSLLRGLNMDDHQEKDASSQS